MKTTSPLASATAQVFGLQRQNTKLRAQLKTLLEQNQHAGVIRDAVGKVQGLDKFRCRRAPAGIRNKAIGHEWLLSDLHIGKSNAYYNYRIAGARAKEYAELIVEHQLRDKPAHTTIALLGDMIENADKHIDSRDECDLTTAEQIAHAIRIVSDFIHEVSRCAGKLTVIGVAGNHENPRGRGSVYAKAGRVHYTRAIYDTVRLICPHVNTRWIIPDGNFALHTIPGVGKICYEHGSEVPSNENAMETMRRKRSKQAQSDLYGLRIGDKHNLASFDGGRLLVNGAFFRDLDGAEYSSAKGYCSTPGQVGVRYIDGVIRDLIIQSFR